uniref:hypothetical protein n=1 Tax=Ndongobacter massiliensis TaxID=1871025 RepID=UPI000931C51C|nr:hypothetical protein [Ndongobacter massiliensis]
MKGIFTLHCLSTGNQYLAAADDVDRAMRQCRDALDRGEFPNAVLQKEWNEYGMKDFEFGVPEQISESDPDDAVLNEVVDDWMNILENVEYLGNLDREDPA